MAFYIAGRATYQITYHFDEENKHSWIIMELNKYNKTKLINKFLLYMDHHGV